MPAGARTEAVVRALWEVGARHGRTPEPSPEVDPWEEDEPLAHHDPAVVVVFPGDPSVVVRLFEDLDDTVVVDDTVDVEVPRRDTVAVVETVLAGGCRVDLAPHGSLANRIATMLHAPFGAELVIPTGPTGRSPVYRAPVPFALPGAWLSRLPTR